MALALEAQSVVKQYPVGSGTVKAVDGVDLNLQRGEFVALVGPSGSGKTTMLAMLAGLLSPTSGSIIIDGQDLATIVLGVPMALSIPIWGTFCSV